MTALDNMIREIKDLTPMPTVANRLLEMVEEPDSSMKDIAQIIQYDPVMTVDILKICKLCICGAKNAGRVHQRCSQYAWHRSDH